MTDQQVEETSERRAKREMRRQKQREANVFRAQKMHAARVSTGNLLYVTPELPTINVGCSGWFYWHWQGAFYPESLPTKEWFSYYSKHFKTVELNAPFYSWPTIANVTTWQRQAGRKKFIYTIKVCELITHIKKLTGTKTLINDFSYIADLLQPRMGCLLYQLPPAFHYTPARLRQIVTQLNSKRRNVVEFRHPSWWNKAVYAALSQADIIFCSCSAPRLPDELITTTDEVYIRFHGKKKWYWYNYKDEELEVWAERFNQSGAKRIWAYFNNDHNAYAINNAKTFLKMLQQYSRSK